MSIVKILTADEWAAMQVSGRFQGSADDRRDGYIHMSTIEQVPGTLAKYFTGRGTVVLLRIDEARIAADLLWEPARGGVLFPHLYAPLEMAAVASFEMLPD